MTRSGSITVQAQSYESLALDTPLRFGPPLAERAADPEAFAFWWKLLEFAFSLPDPATFPTLPQPPGGADLAALNRYVSAAEEMAESAVLSGSDRMTIRAPDDDASSEVIETDFSSSEATRGFVVLFRQFDSNKEPASFAQTQRILRAANARTSDGLAEQRQSILQTWGKACGRLRGQNLRVRVGEKLQDQGRFPHGELPHQRGMSPEQLISAYQYGDLIHWGSKRAEIETIATDPFQSAWQRLAFLEAVTGVIHLYLGFSLLIRAALDRG